MSVQGIGGASLPVVDQAAMPAEVRNGTDKQKQAYASALGFERMLIEQLTKPLAQDATGDADSADSDAVNGDSVNGEQADGAGSMYTDLISGSLADGIAQQGGLGMANDLYKSFEAGLQ